jgi:hypothetical protein
MVASVDSLDVTTRARLALALIDKRSPMSIVFYAQRSLKALLEENDILRSTLPPVYTGRVIRYLRFDQAGVHRQLNAIVDIEGKLVICPNNQILILVNGGIMKFKARFHELLEQRSELEVFSGRSLLPMVVSYQN